LWLSPSVGISPHETARFKLPVGLGASLYFNIRNTGVAAAIFLCNKVRRHGEG
jgi:hypothetical protein